MSEEIEVVAWYSIDACRHGGYAAHKNPLPQSYVDQGALQEPLMTVAQHCRIVEQCKRDAERVRAALLDIVEESTDHGAVLCARAALNQHHAQGCGACGDACKGKQCRVKEESPPDHIADNLEMLKPTDKMIVRGAEELHDSLRSFGVYIDFDRDLNGGEIQEKIAESVFLAMISSAQQAEVKP